METKRCTIRSLSIEDEKIYYDLQSNEEVRKYLGGVCTFIETKDKFINALHSKDLHFVVVDKHSLESIGIVSIDLHHDGINKEISYQFLPNYWGYGLAKESIKSIIDYAFNMLNINELIAETQTANHRSCRLLESLGFVLKDNVVRFGELQAIYLISSKY